MTLVTLVLVVLLTVSTVGLQQKQAGRGRANTAVPSKEHIAKVIQKRKAFRSRAADRRTDLRRRIDASRTAFLEKRQKALDESNRTTLERIKRGR